MESERKSKYPENINPPNQLDTPAHAPALYLCAKHEPALYSKYPENPPIS